MVNYVTIINIYDIITNISNSTNTTNNSNESKINKDSIKSLILFFLLSGFITIFICFCCKKIKNSNDTRRHNHQLL